MAGTQGRRNRNARLSHWLSPPTSRFADGSCFCCLSLQSALFPLVPIARIAALQSEAAIRAVPLPQAPGTLTLGVASSVMGAQVPD